MYQTNEFQTRVIVTGAGPNNTATGSAAEIAVVRMLALTEQDTTESGLEARATGTSSVLEEILHYNPPTHGWGRGLNEW
jgi:hypothetical protein